MRHWKGHSNADDTVELAQVILEEAPDAIKTGEIKNHFGRKVAIVSISRVVAGNVLTVARTRRC